MQECRLFGKVGGNSRNSMNSINPINLQVKFNPCKGIQIYSDEKSSKI